eukprot:Em0022g832a
MNIPFEMTSTMDRYYEAERNVALREKGAKLEYLVLWSDDYPKEQASWVRHKDVTPALLRSFEFFLAVMEIQTTEVELLFSAISHYCGDV